MERPKDPSRGRRPAVAAIAALGGAAAVIGVLIWQAVATAGTPDPTVRGLSSAAVVLSSAVLVVREGLGSGPGKTPP